jgi:broad specificity phosphatase PhoE
MLILIRHGESAANVDADNSDGKYNKLTEKGTEQAKAIKPVLDKYFTIDHVFTSPATRCVKTAELCCSKPAAILDDIYELSSGLTDGVKISDWVNIPRVGKELNRLYQVYKDKPLLDTIFDKQTVAISKRLSQLAKSEGEYPKRLKRALLLAKSYTDRGKTVLFVTHGGVVNAYINVMFSMGRGASGKTPNCSISVIDMKKHKLLLNKYTI